VLDTSDFARLRTGELRRRAIGPLIQVGAAVGARAATNRSSAQNREASDACVDAVEVRYGHGRRHNAPAP